MGEYKVMNKMNKSKQINKKDKLSIYLKKKWMRNKVTNGINKQTVCFKKRENREQRIKENKQTWENEQTK